MLEISYDGLFRQMRKNGLQKSDLRAMGFSSSIINRFVRNESVTTYTLLRMCEIFDCQISDLVECRRVA